MTELPPTRRLESLLLRTTPSPIGSGELETSPLLDPSGLRCSTTLRSRLRLGSANRRVSGSFTCDLLDPDSSLRSNFRYAWNVILSGFAGLRLVFFRGIRQLLESLFPVFLRFYRLLLGFPGTCDLLSGDGLVLYIPCWFFL